jgi:hypothetical protein
MSGANHEWSSWEASIGFQRRVQEALKRHRDIPNKTASEYLAERRVELARELEGKKLIYLDTKHWVNLCHVVVQSSRQLAIYDEVLHLLESTRQKGRICCPVSSTLFLELLKQNDDSTRQPTARIMDFLSGGVCLQNWLDLAKAEFGRHICRVFNICDTRADAFPTWTKVGFWAGEHTFTAPGDEPEDGPVMERVYIDLRWQMTCEEYQAMPDRIPTPDAFWIAWVAEAERAKSHQKIARETFAHLVRDRRRQLLSALKDTLLPMLALCQGLPGSPDHHVKLVLGPIYEGRDPHALPSLEVVAGLDAAITLDIARKVQANDMEDYLHAGQALPHCDAVFCDNFMAQKLKNRPLEFGKTYQTEIGSRPEEILAYLKNLI